MDKKEIIKCPRCGEVMIYDKEMNFWKCPRCDSEFWPPEETQGSMFKGMWEVYAEDVKRPGRKKGGNNKTGRSRKKKYKPVPTERYIL